MPIQNFGPRRRPPRCVRGAGATGGGEGGVERLPGAVEGGGGGDGGGASEGRDIVGITRVSSGRGSSPGWAFSPYSQWKSGAPSSGAPSCRGRSFMSLTLPCRHECGAARPRAVVRAGLARDGHLRG